VNVVPRGIRPYDAKPISVRTGPDSRPVEVDGRKIFSISEDWLVEESWWSDRQVRRHYFEVVLDGGHNLTLFRALPGGSWFSQRA